MPAWGNAHARKSRRVRSSRILAASLSRGAGEQESQRAREPGSQGVGAAAGQAVEIGSGSSKCAGTSDWGRSRARLRLGLGAKRRSRVAPVRRVFVAAAARADPAAAGAGRESQAKGGEADFAGRKMASCGEDEVRQQEQQEEVGELSPGQNGEFTLTRTSRAMRLARVPSFKLLVGTN